MNINKLLVAAVLVIAIGAPIAGIFGDMNGAQPMTSTGVRAPFLHGFPTRPTLQVTPSWLHSIARTNGSIRRP